MRKLIILLSFIGVFSISEVNAQLFRTQLKVTVLDDAGNSVENAEVVLYKSEEDFKKEQNPISDKLKTDVKGVVKFDNLEAKVYFILVQKGDMNNWNGGIKTDALIEKKVNKINIIID